MAAGGVNPLSAVDWGAPWLQPWRQLGEPLAQRAVAHDAAVHAVLQSAAASNAAAERPVCFGPQSDLPAGTAYEQFIFDQRRVPTRDNLHDFFNGLVWLQFPQAKRRLNQLQAQAIAADGVQAVRGPLRDALTVFDENGAVLCAPPPLWDALRARDWLQLFVELRPLWGEARLVLFGHALMEKLVSPRKPMVAHVFAAPDAMHSVAEIDRWLATAMQADTWAAKPFAPLPVLGVPGWWPANAEPGFYDDAQVFRPSPVARAGTGG